MMGPKEALGKGLILLLGDCLLLLLPSQPAPGRVGKHTLLTHQETPLGKGMHKSLPSSLM